MISTHAPAGGATVAFAMARTVQSPFLLTPLREGRHRKHAIFDRKLDFYSRPCGRGDASRKWSAPLPILISTHAPAGGATISNNGSSELVVFLLTPLREGRPKPFAIAMLVPYFYSRPCGRGDQCEGTPLFFATYFYSRPCGRGDGGRPESEKANAFISTHAPAGGATEKNEIVRGGIKFLLTPLREGRLEAMSKVKRKPPNFYSRPCGRGDAAALVCNRQIPFYFYSRPCGRGDVFFQREEAVFHISTHAPAGGATSRIYYVDAASYISTHAPAGGATTTQTARRQNGAFLLTPLREGRLAGCRRIRRSARFLLTPLREGRPRRR